MSLLGTSKGVLEIAKFGVYVTTVPLVVCIFSPTTLGIFRNSWSLQLDSLTRLLQDQTIIDCARSRARTIMHAAQLEVLKEIAKQGFGSNPKDNYENNTASCIAESQDTGSSTSTSLRMMAQDLNDGYHVTEALRVQMEVQ